MTPSAKIAFFIINNYGYRYIPRYMILIFSFIVNDPSVIGIF
jgi:hypothetical protein